MDTTLIAAIVCITGAAILYTFAVIAEWRKHYLKTWHAALFGLGLLFDASGTQLMSQLSDSATTYMSPTAQTLMAVSGTAAIVLMFIHFVFALIVINLKNEDMRHKFHVYSLIIWGVWMISFVLGIVGMIVS